MTQETAKERTYREALDEIKKVCDTQDYVDNDLLRFFITKKMMEIENLPSTTGNLSFEKLQEQLNTAKYFFKNILDVNPNLHGGNSVMHLKNCVNVMKISAGKALVAIGGDGCPVGAVGNNGLTKEELEGSGDE